MSISKFNAFLIILLIGFSGADSSLIYYTYYNPLQNTINNVTVGLDVKAYHPNGNMFAERNMPNDLVLDNFNNLLRIIFVPYTGNLLSSPAKFTSGSVTNICLLSSGCTTGYVGWDITASCNTAPYCGAVLQIGTGTGQTRADYKLNTQYGSTFAVTSTVCNSASTDTVVFSGSISITSTATIQEAGAGINYVAPTGGIILYFHDSFTGIGVVNGDTVTIQYTINLNNAGFNDNLCVLLAGMFTGQLTTGSYGTNVGVSVSFITTGGASNSFYVWCNGNYYLIATTSSCGNPFSVNDVWISIGTALTTFTPSTHNLGSQLSTSVISTSNYVSANGRVYWTSNFVIGSSNTIQEAGMIIKLSTNNYMFFATSFTGQAQTSNVPFGITLEVSD